MLGSLSETFSWTQFLGGVELHDLPFKDKGDLRTQLHLCCTPEPFSPLLPLTRTQGPRSRLWSQFSFGWSWEVSNLKPVRPLRGLGKE